MQKRRNIRLPIFLIAMASVTYSCCTFGLVPVCHRYVTDDTAENNFTIYTVEDSIPIKVAVNNGLHSGRADFVALIWPEGWTDGKFNKKIKICVKQLSLDTYHKKTEAQIYKAPNIYKMNSDNMCFEYPITHKDEGTPVFVDTYHAWHSNAIIEGTVEIYLDDRLLDEVHFKRNLRKISDRPICFIGD